MKTIGKIISIGLLVGMTTSCEDLKFGENFLEKPVSDEMSIDEVFSQKIFADQALNQFYKSLPDFMPVMSGYHPGGHILDNYTDIGYTQRLSWNSGSFDASSGSTNFPYQLSHKEVLGDPTFGIRKAYIYIENVDRVPDMTDDEKRIRKAEAKVVIANHYIQMIRFHGAVPWISRSYKADEVFVFPRITLEETVEKVATLLNEAAIDLPWYTTEEEYGHLTAAAAKALEFRLRLFVASPLFNNTEPYFAGQAADEHLTWYGDYQRSRWEKALAVGREFIRLNKENGDYYQIQNSGNPQEDYVSGYFVKGNREVIMASFRWGIYEKGIKPFRMYESGYGSPRGNYADMFQWKDGSDFNWDNPEHRAHPFFDAKGKPTRDARLYETLVVNEDKWQGRKAEVYNNGGREGSGTGSLIAQKTQYGYGYRKFIRDKQNEMHNKPYSCPLVRIPEIFLSMAEVMNQLDEATQKDEFGNDAYDYLNMVHTRAGLPAVTADEVPVGDALWNYLMDERAREFGQEEIRYFDLIRYKKGAEWITRPVEILETTKQESGFDYKTSVREDIKYRWMDYWYLMPFPTAEINKKYGLIQNPGW